MNRCFFMPQNWNANVRTLVGGLTLFCFLFMFPGLVEALQTALVRTSDGDVYQIRFRSKDPRRGGYDLGDFVQDFSIYDQSGRVKLCPSNDDEITWELYTAARVLAKTKRKTSVYSKSDLIEAFKQSAENLGYNISTDVAVTTFVNTIAESTGLQKLSVGSLLSSGASAIVNAVSIITSLANVEFKLRKVHLAFSMADRYANTAIRLQNLANQHAPKLWDAINAGEIFEVTGSSFTIDSAELLEDIGLLDPLQLRLIAEVYQSLAEKAIEEGTVLSEDPEASDVLLGVLGISAIIEFIPTAIDAYFTGKDLERLDESISTRMKNTINRNIQQIYHDATYDLKWHGFCSPRLNFAAAYLDVYEGATLTYTVFLNSPPDSAAIITISSDNNDATVTPNVLTFTPSDWYKPKVVTLRAATDTDDINDRVNLSHTSSGYGDGRIAEISFTIVDRKGNNFPVSVETIPPLRLGLGDEFRLDLANYFRDPENAKLNYWANSEDFDVVSALPDRSGSWITIKPWKIGSTKVVAGATDPGGLRVSQTFTVTVAAAGVNTAPTPDIPPTEEPSSPDTPTTELPPTSDIPTTEVPPTPDIPNTEVPTTPDIPTTEAPTTPDIPNTEVPTTPDIPTTEAPPPPDIPNTEVPPSPDIPNTEVPPPPDIPITEVPSTPEIPNTEVPPPPEIPTTEVPSTPEIPITEVPSTPEIPITEVPTTPEIPITEVPTTPEIPITEVPPPPEIPTTEVPPPPEIPTTEVPPPPEIPTTEVPPPPEIPITEVPPPPEIPTTEVPTTPIITTVTIPGINFGFGDGNTQTENVCDRTEQVLNAILAAIDTDDCANLDSNDLDSITTLVLSNTGITALQEKDFEGLSGLDHLDLHGNSLSSLSVGLFDDLRRLKTLDLKENSLRSLPVDVFDELGSLRQLDLKDNDLIALPVGVFDGLNALESLNLKGNQLTTLPKGIFDKVLNTLKADSLSLDDSLKTTFGFSTTTQNAAEGDTVRVRVTLNRSLPVAIRVPYTIGGTARASDYRNLRPRDALLFRAGETSQEIVFTLLEDADRRTETVLLTLGELSKVKVRKSDGRGPNAKLSAHTFLNPPQQRVHTTTVTAAGVTAAPLAVAPNAAPRLPVETGILPNYPNPFNPETWIPYQLAAPADVTLTIYTADGKIVHTLVLGHKPTGLYQSKSRAAYWDGKNEVGESVASGLYFYTLTAGEFTATRKMLIRK